MCLLGHYFYREIDSLILKILPFYGCFMHINSRKLPFLLELFYVDFHALLRQKIWPTLVHFCKNNFRKILFYCFPVLTVENRRCDSKISVNTNSHQMKYWGGTSELVVFIMLNKNYYVVRNNGCAQSRYTLKLSLIFLNQWINQQSISRTADPPLKSVKM